MRKRTVQWIAAGFFLTMFTACTNFGLSSSSTTRYYILDTIPDVIAQSEKEGKNFATPLCGVGPVTIPPYLNRPQMVTRLGDHELRIEDFRLWAEPLRENIPRVIAQNLSLLIGSEKIYLYPWKRSDQISLQLMVDIFRFDADVDGNVILEALWRIVDVEQDRLLMENRYHSVKPSSGTDIAKVVDGMNKTLINLSQSIADALSSLER